MIGITGVARSGKDTLYKLIEKKLAKESISTKRFALADNLKKDLKEFILNKFNINLDSCTPEEKEIVRPIMVAYGKSKRKQTEGRYWINLLDSELSISNIIPVVTDIRYDEYPRDEYFWLSKEKNGFLIHISRVHDGKIIPPANEEEYKNDKILSEKSNYKMIWCTESNSEVLYSTYEKNIIEIYEQYRRHIFNK